MRVLSLSEHEQVSGGNPLVIALSSAVSVAAGAAFNGYFTELGAAAARETPEEEKPVPCIDNHTYTTNNITNNYQNTPTVSPETPQSPIGSQIPDFQSAPWMWV